MDGWNDVCMLVQMDWKDVYASMDGSLVRWLVGGRNVCILGWMGACLF